MMTPVIQWLRSYLADTAKGLERFANRYYGVYTAKVIDNADPANRGRVRAICPAIGHSKPEHVSADFWAMPAMNGVSVDENNKIVGNFCPPEENANIWIMFENGDARFPIYIGGWIVGNVKETEGIFSDVKNKGLTKRGIRTTAGHYLSFDDDPDRLVVELHRGNGSGDSEGLQSIVLDDEGGVVIKNKNGGGVMIDGSGDSITIELVDDKKVKQSTVKLSKDGFEVSTQSGGSVKASKRNLIISGDKLVVDTKIFRVNGKTFLGRNASEPAIRGYKFATGWGVIHQHTCAAPTMPTTVGATPPVLMNKELSNKVFIE